MQESLPLSQESSPEESSQRLVPASDEKKSQELYSLEELYQNSQHLGVALREDLQGSLQQEAFAYDVARTYGISFDEKPHLMQTVQRAKERLLEEKIPLRPSARLENSSSSGKFTSFSETAFTLKNYPSKGGF